MSRDFMANHWRQDSPLYLDPETGLPLALGPITMRRAKEDGRWHFEGPKGVKIPEPEPDIWQAYHRMVDAYAAWFATEPWRKVYFIGEAAEIGKRVKIGTAASPHQRLRQLQVGSPAPLAILAVTRGDEGLETEYHDRFRVQRRHGEWFMIDRKILAEIERLQA